MLKSRAPICFGLAKMSILCALHDSKDRLAVTGFQSATPLKSAIFSFGLSLVTLYIMRPYFQVSPPHSGQWHPSRPAAWSSLHKRPVKRVCGVSSGANCRAVAMNTVREPLGQLCLGLTARVSFQLLLWVRTLANRQGKVAKSLE